MKTKECFKKNVRRLNMLKTNVSSGLYFKIQWYTLECENDYPGKKWTVGHKQFISFFGTTELVYSILQ